MDGVREMPYKEKLEGIMSFASLVEDFAPRLVRAELGKEKVGELWEIWKTESEPIPDGASDRDK
jgi:hypothetical protein